LGSRTGPEGPVTICGDLDRCVVMAVALPRLKGDAGGIQGVDPLGWDPLKRGR